MPGLESYVRRVQSAPAVKPRSAPISAKREDGARLARGGSAIIRPVAQGLPDPVVPQIDAGAIGQVAYFAVPTPPPGWLECNGQSILREDYPRYFEFLDSVGIVENFQIALPDLRGAFVRALDNGRGRDVERQVLDVQSDAVIDHQHGLGHIEEVRVSTVIEPSESGVLVYKSIADGGLQRDDETGGIRPADPLFSGETRPINVALLACIRVA